MKVLKIDLSTDKVFIPTFWFEKELTGEFLTTRWNKVHAFKSKSNVALFYYFYNNTYSVVQTKNIPIPLYSWSVTTDRGDIFMTGGFLKPNYLATTFKLL